MTAVFVHGNPETDAIWGPLRAAIAKQGGQETVALSPPGFGAPVPAGFDATPQSYVSWLVNELEAMGEPVDLVGHDWGAGHVMGTLAARPDLISSWATDCVGLVHADYQWHDAAQAWQTADVGEEVVAMMMNMPLPDRIEAFVGLGIPVEVAEPMVASFDDVMGDCILKLYRGAAQPYVAQLGERVVAGAHPKGLAIIATEDSYVSEALGSAMVGPLGAAELRLAGQDHWWMFTNVEHLATQFISFWNA